MLIHKPESQLGIPRLAGWMLAAILLSALVFEVSPQQMKVVAYKLDLVMLAAFVSYWLDRSIFGETAQPRLTKYDARDTYGAARILCRALIYLGTVLGLTLGL